MVSAVLDQLKNNTTIQYKMVSSSVSQYKTVGLVKKLKTINQPTTINQ
jgi:hypothetical protein